MDMKDLTGKRFTRLLVVSRKDNDNRMNAMWLCQCDCGKQTIVRSSCLKSKNTQSCGCLAKNNNLKHGHRKNSKTTAIYNSWRSMIQRCTNTKHEQYKDYGDRGITVCKEWLKFENFLIDMRKEWKPGLTIERKKNAEGYHPSNCKWTTTKENNRNKRNNLYIQHNKQSRLLIDLSEETKIPYKTLYARIYIYKWSIKKALETSIRRKR